MTNNIVANPGVIGASVSVASAVESFCAQGLPVIQFLSATFGGIAAIMSITWIATQMVDRYTRKRKERGQS